MIKYINCKQCQMIKLLIILLNSKLKFCLKRWGKKVNIRLYRLQLYEKISKNSGTHRRSNDGKPFKKLLKILSKFIHGL